MQEQQPLQVAECLKIINLGTGGAVLISVKQIAKFVVGLGNEVAPTDIEEGMQVGVDRNKYFIQLPLPPKIDRRGDDVIGGKARVACLATSVDRRNR